MELTRCGFRLTSEQVKELGRDCLAELKSRCTVTAVEDPYTIVPVSVCCLQQHKDGSVTFPPHVPLQGLGLPSAIQDVRCKPLVLPDFPAFVGSLDENRKQISAREAVLDSLRSRGSGILSLSTGYGKTCCAINVACTLRVKTLVIVHKEVLLTQWEERINTFAPGAKVGRIQGATTITEGCHFVIGMLQSLSTRSYDRATFDEFDFVIVDECHHVAARVFSRALRPLCVPYRLGLSAYVERKDGLTDVIKWHLGEVCFLVERKGESGLTVETMRYEQPAYKQPAPLFRNGQLALCKMIDVLCNDPHRNKMIIDMVQELAQSGRCILVLSDRRDHCSALQKALVEQRSRCGPLPGRHAQGEPRRGCRELADHNRDLCDRVRGLGYSPLEHPRHGNAQERHPPDRWAHHKGRQIAELPIGHRHMR